MRLIILILFLAVHFAKAQTTTSFQLHSRLLNENRTIRIHLPASFDPKTDKEYPLILSLDGEYLFYSLLGPYEISSIQKNIPETIIAGIDQNYPDGNYTARWNDCSYDYNSGEIEGKGILFRQFILQELLPYLSANYKTGKFKSIAGHSYTANYINYFLSDSTFSGFIAVSPYIPESSESQISQFIKSRKQDTYYYLSTGENDLSGHIPQINRQDSTIFSKSDNVFFHYTFKNYENETHMTLASRSIMDAILHVFSGYAPLYALEDGDSVLFRQENLLDYLKNRYENIQKIYNITIPVREDELAYIWGILEEKEDWKQLNEIGKYTIKHYPESIYGYYMRGKAEESLNNLENALKLYKEGYAKLGEDILNKSDFYENIQHVETLIEQRK